MTAVFTMKGSRLAGLLPSLLLVVVTVALYTNSLRGGFVWDDSLFVANPVYWNFDFRTICLSLANGLEYQPVRDLTYLADIALWGGRPFGFHCTNLLLFTVIVLLVYQVSARFHARFISTAGAVPSPFVPLLTALLFAVHPLRCEVVAWITQRNTLLATLFFLLAVLGFCRYQEQRANKYLALASGAFLLAVLSKATVIILPLLLLLLLVAEKEPKWRRAEFWLPLLPFALLAAAATALHLTVAGRTTVISAAYYGSWQERVAVALQIPFFYLRKMVFPLDISAFYAEKFALAIFTPQALVAALLLAAFAVAAWLLRQRFPELLLGGGWFIITLLPVSNLFATSPVVADRYLFLPAIGPVFLLAALLGRLRLPSGVAGGIALLLLVPLLLLTVARNRVWHDDISLWSATAVTTPQVAGVWYNLGRAWHRTPQLGMALEAYLRAVSLDPGDMKSLDNAATLFPSSRGSLVVRHELVRDLAAKLPAYPAGLALVGFTAARWHCPDAAEELFLNLLSADSSSTPLRLALANLYLQSGAPGRAKAIYADIVSSGQGKGEAEFGLAAIAAAEGSPAETQRLLAIARNKGGVPEALLQSLAVKKAPGI